MGDSIPGASGNPPPANLGGGKRRSAWMAHVKATMRANKGKPLSAVLKMAKKTYKKKKGGNVPIVPLPLGGRRGSRKGSRRSRKH